MKQILLGSVAYDPKVVTIWEGIKEFFLEHGVGFDFVLFSNYEAQIEALVAQFIDIAWNTNLAYVKTDWRTHGQARALAMRDTDIGFTTRVIVSSSNKEIDSLRALKAKRLAFGSRDSAQAAIIPEYYLRLEGLIPDKDYSAIRFNTDLGKHGDTGKSEIDVVQAVKSGAADAGAIGETMWQSLQQSDAAKDFVSIWTSPPYSHCNFTALPSLDEERAELFVKTLMQMDYSNPAHRPILDMEGLKKWVTCERSGYDSVFKAAEATEYLGEQKAAAPF